MKISSVVHFLTRTFFSLLQKLLNCVLGPSKKDKKFDGCLCFDILKYRRFDTIKPPTSDVFLLRFRGTEEISRIKQDDVIFFSVEEDYYVFIRLPPDLADKKFDFTKYTFGMMKEKDAIEVIKVRHDLINDFVNKNWDVTQYQGGHIYCLYNTGRCGSTLLAAMVAQLPEFRVLSEPGTLLSLKTFVRNKNVPITPDNKELLAVTRNVLLLTAPDTSTKYYIKIHTGANDILPLIKPALPQIHETFMYRSLKPAVNSLKKLVYLIEIYAGIPIKITINRIVSNNNRILADSDSNKFNIAWKDDPVKFKDYCLVHAAISKVIHFQKCTEGRNDIPAYCYDDLLNHKEEFCRHYIKGLGISEDRMNEFAEGLEKDSQKDSMLNRENMKKVKFDFVTAESLEWGKMAASKMGLKIEGEDYQFIGINCKVRL